MLLMLLHDDDDDDDDDDDNNKYHTKNIEHIIFSKIKACLDMSIIIKLFKSVLGNY